MENISRRRALALLPAAGAAMAVPVAAMAVPSEKPPREKVLRLARELRGVLATIDPEGVALILAENKRNVSEILILLPNLRDRLEERSA